MKRILCIGLALLFIFSLSACNRRTPPAPSPMPSANPAPNSSIAPNDAGGTGTGGNAGGIGDTGGTGGTEGTGGTGTGGTGTGGTGAGGTGTGGTGTGGTGTGGTGTGTTSATIPNFSEGTEVNEKDVPGVKSALQEKFEGAKIKRITHGMQNNRQVYVVEYTNQDGKHATTYISPDGTFLTSDSIPAQNTN